MTKFVKHISRYKLQFLLVVTLLTALPCNTYAQQVMVNGKADLTAFDFNAQNAELNGSWAFAWQKFIPSYKGSDLIDSSSFLHVPSLWNGQIIHKKLRNGHSFSTYYAEIKVSDTITHLALRLQRIESAYNLYINDSLYIKCGQPGKSIYSEKPEKRNEYIVFPVHKGKFTITLHVSNFHHRKGGISDAPVLGFPATVERTAQRERSLDAFIIGALLIIVFYHFGIFFLHRKEYSALFFGGMALAVILHRLTNGELLISDILPQISWEYLLKTDHIALYLQLSFFLLFFNSVYSKYIRKILIKAVMVASVIMIIFIFVTSARYFTEALVLFEIMVLLTVIGIIFVQIKTLILEKNRVYLLPFFGTLILLLSGVNDVFHESGFINTRHTFHFGLLIFTFLQSYLLSSKFSALIIQNEKLNKKLIEIDALKTVFTQSKGFSLQSLLSTLLENFGGDRAVIISVNQNEHSIRSSFPTADKNLHNYPETFADKAIQSRKPQFINSKHESETRLSFEYQSKSTLKSAVAIPLKAGNSVKHVLYVESYKHEALFDMQMAEGIDILSNQIAGLVENQDVYGRLESMNTNLEETIEQRTAELMQQREELHTQREAIEQQNESLSELYKDISAKNILLNSGIHYAKRIHSALLPGKTVFEQHFPNNFVFIKQKEILGGDFFWSAKIVKQTVEYQIFAVVDCTGHGIPGALMSIIGTNLLYEACRINQITEPGLILDFMQNEIKHRLHQSGRSESRDGMDLSLISYVPHQNILTYAGARNPIFLTDNNEIIELKADRMSIGGADHARLDTARKFTTNQLTLKNGMILYFATDGYSDQTGGEHGRKFMKSRLVQLLSFISSLPMSHQKYQVEAIITKWKGENPQLDDITVVGIKF